MRSTTDEAPRARRGGPPAEPAGGACLDPTDAAIMRLLAEGWTFGSISRRLTLSERTVRRRIRIVADEIGADSTIEVVVWAVRRGLI